MTFLRRLQDNVAERVQRLVRLGGNQEDLVIGTAFIQRAIAAFLQLVPGIINIGGIKLPLFPAQKGGGKETVKVEKDQHFSHSVKGHMVISIENIG